MAFLKQSEVAQEVTWLLRFRSCDSRLPDSWWRPWEMTKSSTLSKEKQTFVWWKLCKMKFQRSGLRLQSYSQYTIVRTSVLGKITKIWGLSLGLLAGVSIFSEGWGGWCSQIGVTPIAGLLAAGALGFWVTVLTCSKIHPEQYVSNISA